MRNSITGCDAPHLIEVLISGFPSVKRVKLFRPAFSKPIQDDISISADERRLIEAALDIRDRSKLAFWDSLFLYLASNPMNAESIIARATLHNSQDHDSFLVSRDSCTNEFIQGLIAKLPERRSLAISSKMLMEDERELHLPMLDFHCLASEASDELVSTVIAGLGLHGYILRSGRSYHFYGDELVDEAELLSILGKALLFCPIIDRAWIAHQIIERACGLRISPGKNYDHCPRIVCRV